MKSLLLRAFVFLYNVVTVPALLVLTAFHGIWFQRIWSKAILPGRERNRGPSGC